MEKRYCKLVEGIQRCVPKACGEACCGRRICVRRIFGPVSNPMVVRRWTSRPAAALHRLGLVLAALAVSVLGTASIAIAADCVSDISKTDFTNDVINCMRELQDENQRLAQKLADLEPGLGAAAAIPLGAIVAFNRTERDPCPDGWSLYEEGKGRFIVGAGHQIDAGGNGVTFLSAGKTGGEEQVTLTIGEMPIHQHVTQLSSIKVVSESSSPTQAVVVDGSPALMTSRDLSTNPTGGNEPHNNMPPYIALYFCKKEAS